MPTPEWNEWGEAEAFARANNLSLEGAIKWHVAVGCTWTAEIRTRNGTYDGCAFCGILSCPYGRSEHEWHDGCPGCFHLGSAASSTRLQPDHPFGPLNPVGAVGPPA